VPCCSSARSPRQRNSLQPGITAAIPVPHTPRLHALAPGPASHRVRRRPARVAAARFRTRVTLSANTAPLKAAAISYARTSCAEIHSQLSVVVRWIIHDHWRYVPVAFCQQDPAPGTHVLLLTGGANYCPFLIEPATFLGLPAKFGV